MKRLMWTVAVLFLSASFLMAAGGSAGTGGSGEWVRSVEIQVPAGAGGGTDVVARALATKVAAIAGNNLAIINNADGGGVVAMEKVRTARPDGSTLLFFHTTMIIKSALGVYNRNAVDDFTIIGVGNIIDSSGYILLVHPDSDITTLDSLIRKAKASPGQLLIGVETGGSSHIMSGLFSKAAGIELKYVEAGPDTEKLTSLVGKNIDMCFVNQNQARQYVESGRAVALGMIPTDLKAPRGVVLPNVPTFPEQGINFSFVSLFFVLGPKGMDPALVNKIHDYYAAAAKDDGVNAILKPAGFAMEFSSNEEGIAKVRAQQQEFIQIAKELGLRQ